MRKTQTQVITFIHGTKKTIRGVYTDSVMQSEMTHMNTKDGRLILVNSNNVLCVDITPDLDDGLAHDTKEMK
jgi:hypothetical protein